MISVPYSLVFRHLFSCCSFFYSLQEVIIPPYIRICDISLRSAYFYIIYAPGANGNSPETRGLLKIARCEEWKIIIYLNARAIVHSEVN